VAVLAWRQRAPMSWLLKLVGKSQGLQKDPEYSESDTGSECLASDLDRTEGSPDVDSIEEPMPPEDVLRLLKAGNDRFVRGASLAVRRNDVVRRERTDLDQPPHAAIVGCSDCQCALETIFDSLPGDIFAFKNVGNTCIHANGSMAASLEFCTDWGCRLILVLGHMPCVALQDATKAFFEKTPNHADRALKSLLHDLRGVVEEAAEELGSTNVEDVTRQAVRVNVFHTVEMLLRMSPGIRQSVRDGQLELQAAVYDAQTRQVEFLGRSKKQEELLLEELSDWEPDLSPSTASPGPCCGNHHGEPTVGLACAAEISLEKLKEGNRRFIGGAIWNKAMERCTTPHSAVLACGDVQAPMDVIFDAMPGEMFVMRNAGNTCTHSAGSIMSSFEFCVEKFNIPLILILGHTPCAAMAGAVRAHLAESEQPGLLESLAAAAAQAEQQLEEGVCTSELCAHAVRLNVFHTMEMVLAQSQLLQLLARQGRLDVQGGIYHKDTGVVEFLGRLPHQDQVLAD